MAKNSKRQRVRRAKRKRIIEVRAMLAMGVDGEWHNTGKHEPRYGYQAEPPLSTCLCKQCVIYLAQTKLGLWLK